MDEAKLDLQVDQYKNGYQVINIQRISRSTEFEDGSHDKALDKLSYEKLMYPSKFLTRSERRSKRLSRKLLADRRIRERDNGTCSHGGNVWERAFHRATKAHGTRTPTPPAASSNRSKSAQAHRYVRHVSHSGRDEVAFVFAEVETPEERQKRLERLLARLLRPSIRTARVRSFNRQKQVLGYTELCRRERQKALAKKMEIQAKKDERIQAARMIQDCYRCYRMKKFREKLHGSREIRQHKQRSIKATMIQALFRGHVARLAITIIIGTRTIMARRIQRYFRRAQQLREAHKAFQEENARYNAELQLAMERRKEWARTVQDRARNELEELAAAHLKLSKADPNQFVWATTDSGDNRYSPDATTIINSISKHLHPVDKVDQVTNSETQNMDVILELPQDVRKPCFRSLLTAHVNVRKEANTQEWVEKRCLDASTGKN